MIKMLLEALSSVWPMIFIFTIILVSIRLFYLLINKKKFVLRKELLMLCFIIYILLLYYVVTFQDNNYGTNNFVPFKEILRYKITSKLFLRNVLGNILLFVPFGVFSSYIIKNKSFIPAAILGFIVSCSIEFAQSAIGRTADIDDVILNTLGSIIGYMLYKIFNKFYSGLPNIMKNSLVLDFLALLMVSLIIFLLYYFLVGGLIR